MSRTHGHSQGAGTDPDTFIGRVRAALGRSNTLEPPSPPVLDESVVRLVAPHEDLVSIFTRRAAEVGMSIHRTRLARWCQDVADQLVAGDTRTVVLGFKDHAEVLALTKVLQDRSVQVVDWRSERGLDDQFDVNVGVTDVHAALAETGTLICCSDAAHSRCLSLIPPVHVAIVHRRDILPDMLDYWRQVEDDRSYGMPSSISFITGPSKTADIEGELITGVHGPGQVHVFIVEDG